jgi:hypothetical protein
MLCSGSGRLTWRSNGRDSTSSSMYLSYMNWSCPSATKYCTVISVLFHGGGGGGVGASMGSRENSVVLEKSKTSVRRGSAPR